MSYVHFCRGDKAKEPYVVPNLRKKLYTIEELCYYIYDNTVLCGEELLKPRLVYWIGSQCGFADLSESIQVILKKDPRPERVASQIFAYTDYLDKAEREAVCERIRKYSQLDMNERKKMRADHFVLAGQYSEAIRNYEEILLEKCYNTEKEMHNIIYDIGCCYAFMFYYNLAFDWFMKASESDIQKEEDLHAALFCQRRMLDEEEYIDFLKEHSEFGTVASEAEQKESRIRQEYEKLPETVSRQWEFRQAKEAGELRDAAEKRLTAYKAEI